MIELQKLITKWEKEAAKKQLRFSKSPSEYERVVLAGILLRLRQCIDDVGLVLKNYRERKRR